METHKCPGCGADVPNERQELLGTPFCVHCTPQRPKPLGVMEYGEKAGGVLAICETRKEFEMLKKPANRRR